MKFRSQRQGFVCIWTGEGWQGTTGRLRRLSCLSAHVSVVGLGWQGPHCTAFRFLMVSSLLAKRSSFSPCRRARTARLSERTPFSWVTFAFAAHTRGSSSFLNHRTRYQADGSGSSRGRGDQGPWIKNVLPRVLERRSRSGAVFQSHPLFLMMASAARISVISWALASSHWSMASRCSWIRREAFFSSS